MPNPTPTPNTPSRDELRDWLVEHTNLTEETGDAVWREFEVHDFLQSLRIYINAHLTALQQTIEAELPDKLNMDDAMLNYGWTDEEYIAWNKALRMCRSAITKAFEAAKAGKDSE